MADFSRNATTKDDTYVKLLNVNTFESEDYGIGLRQNLNVSSLSQVKNKRTKSAVTARRQKSPEAGAGGTGETPSDPSQMKLLDQIKYYATKRFGKSSVKSARYKELCSKYLKTASDLTLNIDSIERIDSKIFFMIIQDFKSLKGIKMYSDVCSLQQLERKNELIVLPQQK